MKTGRAKITLNLVSLLQKLAGFQEKIQLEVLRRLGKTPLACCFVFGLE